MRLVTGRQRVFVGLIMRLTHDRPWCARHDRPGMRPLPGTTARAGSRYDSVWGAIPEPGPYSASVGRAM